MAEDRSRYEALIAAVDRFGRLDEVRSRLEQRLADVEARWVPVRDGCFVDFECRSWLDWNVTRDGRTSFPPLDADGHPFDAIVDVNRQLREHGIDFLLVTFPMRGQLYPELYMDLPSQEGFAGFCPGTARFALALIDAGVEVLYLAPEFVAARHAEDPERGALYLSHGPHWAPRAAELAARLVADRVRRFPWYEASRIDPRIPHVGKSKEGETWILRDEERDVALAFGGVHAHAKPERFLVTRVLHPEQRRLTATRHPSSPLSLLTDSFGFFHSSSDCDFTLQLFRFLETPIDEIVAEAIADSCREELAGLPEKLKARKKLVIWLIPESALRLGPIWRRIDLFPTAAPDRRSR